MTRCEVGPATLRLLDSITGIESGAAADDLVDAALAAGDDELTLLGDRPVSVTQLWPAAFAAVLSGRGIDEVELIHPSWWTATRVAAVARAAGQFVGSVSTTPRSRAFGGATNFVEIAPRFVLVGTAGGTPRLVDRAAPISEVLQRVCRLTAEPAGVIHVDAPPAVPGAEVLGSALANRLACAGHQVEMGRLETLRPTGPPTRPLQVAVASKRPRRVLVVVAAVAVGLSGAGLAVPLLHAGGPGSETQTLTATVELIEGALAVEVPADWLVERITGGPGSDRVRVVSPRDPHTAVHITQSRVPQTDLAATAATLADAMATQPPGVFVDFDAAAQRAGRPVVAYREVRAGHDIEWVVVSDGDLRIGIGCQSGPGGAASIDAICDQVLRSAHQVR